MNNLDTLIENGLVVTENKIGHLNIGIKDSKIAYLGDENLNAEFKINASDLIVLPGGIDPHVHVDQPSGDDVIMADNFQSATKSAAAWLIFSLPHRFIGEHPPDVSVQVVASVI